MIILDTNVVAELMRPACDQRVLSWLRSVDAVVLATTAVTVAEIEYGLARLPESKRKQDLVTAAARVWQLFPESVMPFDAAASKAYGSLMAQRERSGTPMTAFDGQIAAIATVQSAQLATRNTADFGGVGLAVINPWAIG